MKPYKFENECPCFLKSQCDLYGMPHHYGYEYYLIISDNESPMVCDYQMELDRKLRPIHRYNRVERFAFTLAQLLGLKGDVDRSVIELVKEHKGVDWESIRTILKKNSLRKMYNRIPYIMNCLGLKPPIDYEISNLEYREMIDEFRCLQKNFYSVKGNRKYFPSLRYICFKMLESRGAVFTDVKFVRTKRKEKVLDELWGSFHNV